jgi:hypothetical protein
MFDKEVISSVSRGNQIVYLKNGYMGFSLAQKGAIVLIRNKLSELLIQGKGI